MQNKHSILNAIMTILNKVELLCSGFNSLKLEEKKALIYSFKKNHYQEIDATQSKRKPTQKRIISQQTFIC